MVFRGAAKSAAYSGKIRLLVQFLSQSAQKEREQQVWRYAHQCFLLAKDPLRKFRILEHDLQEILFVAHKVHYVVVITTAGGHSFYEETQIRLGQVQHLAGNCGLRISNCGFVLCSKDPSSSSIRNPQSAIRNCSSRSWNHGGFDTLAGPSEIQCLLKFRKWKLFGDNFVDFHAAAFQVGNRPRKAIELRE